MLFPKREFLGAAIFHFSQVREETRNAANWEQPAELDWKKQTHRRQIKHKETGLDATIKPLSQTYW